MSACPHCGVTEVPHQRGCVLREPQRDTIFSDQRRKSDFLVAVQLSLFGSGRILYLRSPEDDAIVQVPIAVESAAVELLAATENAMAALLPDYREACPELSDEDCAYLSAHD